VYTYIYTCIYIHVYKHMYVLAYLHTRTRCRVQKQVFLSSNAYMKAQLINKAGYLQVPRTVYSISVFACVSECRALHLTV